MKTLGNNPMHTKLLEQIANNIVTQDNRITDQPMFIVQEKIRDYGYEEGYADDYEWMIEEGHGPEKASPAVAMLLDRLLFLPNPSEWKRITRAYKVGYCDRWEFVTACFTEQACEDFIRIDGHNHGELRIYAAGSFRNIEFRTIRNALIGMANQED